MKKNITEFVISAQDARSVNEYLRANPSLTKQLIAKAHKYKEEQKLRRKAMIEHRLAEILPRMTQLEHVRSYLEERSKEIARDYEQATAELAGLAAVRDGLKLELAGLENGSPAPAK